MQARLEDELKRTALALADLARPITLRHFRAPMLGVIDKGAAAFDPVTAADREAEAAIRAALARLRPQDGIEGEELGRHPGSSGLTWVLDPVDGTRAFLSGAPTWGVLIAVAGAEGPLLGVIDQPYIGERFLGGFGEAWVDGPQGRARLVTRA